MGMWRKTVGYFYMLMLYFRVKHFITVIHGTGLGRENFKLLDGSIYPEIELVLSHRIGGGVELRRDVRGSWW